MVVGVIGLAGEVGGTVLGYPVIGTDADLGDLRRVCPRAILAIGQIKSPLERIRLAGALEREQFKTPAIVSSSAHVSRHAVVGAGSIVMHGAVVNASATVGRHCILNSQSLVEHDVTVADHCHVSTGARINSGVTIGAGTFVGSGTVVRQLVRIGEGCVIGMGQRVLTDCAAGSWLPTRKGAL